MGDMQMLPQAIDSENIVIGTLLNYGNAYSKIADILTVDCFYNHKNKRIYGAIVSVCERGDTPDMIMVKNELAKTGEPLAYELVELAANSSAQIYNHALYVKEQFIRRQVITIAQQAVTQAYFTGLDIDDVINNLYDNIKNVYSNAASGVIHISEAVERMRENIKKNMLNKNKLPGSYTGFTAFDKRSGGLQPTDLVIVAGESSMGKTSFALSVANNIASYGDEIAIYSLEMSSMQLAARISSMNTGIPSNEILYSRLTNEQMERIETNINRICNTGIYIDERSTSNMDTIISSIRNMVRKPFLKFFHIWVPVMFQEAENTEEQLLTFESFEAATKFIDNISY